MVKVGFICEGDTESILLQSGSFNSLLAELSILSVNVINAEGSGNLLPHNIAGYIDSLEKQDAEVIIILTDLDNDVCITQTKQRINARLQDCIIISVKQIESWFLAETNTMRKILGEPDFFFEQPENEVIPFNTINLLLVNQTGRGIGTKSGGKIKLAKRMLDSGLVSANHQFTPIAQVQGTL